MVLLRVRVHPRGLSLPAQRKVFALRHTKNKKGKKLSWPKIAAQVVNLQGVTPGWKVCRDAYNRMNTKLGMPKDNYHKCGRKAALTKAVRKWVVSQLVSRRNKMEVTSVMLTRLLAARKHIQVEASTVRRALNAEGYYYLSRTKKPKYNKDQRQERLKISQKLAKMTDDQVKEEFHFSMGGVVAIVPPSEPIARENFIHSDIVRVWRKPSEGALTALHGYDCYAKQAPKSRIIPFWGGLGPKGYATVMFHGNRKTDASEWDEHALKSGALLKALRAVAPRKVQKPWKVLCDNESFLREKGCMKQYAKMRVELKKLPAKSPDLNPIEKMWGWMRKRLRSMDLADLAAGRAVPGKRAYRERIKRLLKSPKAQEVAKNFFRNLRTVAKKIVKAKGGAVHG